MLSLLLDSLVVQNLLDCAFVPHCSPSLCVPTQVAEQIRHLITAHTAVIPTVLEIPSKEAPYDEKKDPIMVRVKKLTAARDEEKA